MPALHLRGIEVMHIIDATHSMEHPWTSPARIVGGELSYASPEGQLLDEAPPPKVAK